MPGHAIHQLAQVTDYDPTDRFYIVPDPDGTPLDRSIERQYLAGQVFREQYTFDSAAVLAWGTTDGRVAGVPDATQVIIPLFYVVEFIGVGTPYATNTEAHFGPAGAVTASPSMGTFDLSQVSDTVLVVWPGLGGTMPAGTAMAVAVPAGNPTAGDAVIRITAHYRKA